MEIVKKAKISVNGKSEEIEAVIDTGADRTMVEEDILLRIGAIHMGNWKVQSMGEFKDVKPVYGVMIEVDGIGFPLTVFGGKKNLIGHDFLQLGKAVINEETGELKLTKSWIEM